MNDFSAWSVWGGGQLFAFSAFDGETDWRNGLVLRSVAAASVLEVKLPEAGGALLFDLAPPRRCLLAGDHFILETASGEVRGAFIDARHLLVEGNCRAVGLSGAVRVATRPGRLLLGARESFDETLLKVDFGAVLASRAAFLAHLPLVQTESETARRALLKACSQLKIQLNSPAGLLRHRWTTPDRWPHRWMWLWDSVFHAAGLQHLDPVAARESLEAVFDVQQEDGFIPHFASPESRSEITQPPLLGFGMELVAGEDDLVRVEHDHMVAGVDMRRINRTVFTSENARDCSCRTPNVLPRQIHDVPALFNLTWLCAECFHCLTL